jgi:hypothetical protein
MVQIQVIQVRRQMEETVDPVREKLRQAVAYMMGRPINEALDDPKWREGAKRLADRAQAMGDMRTAQRLRDIIAAVDRVNG